MLHMYEEWKKNEPVIDDIPLEQYEELVMSCTSTKTTYQDEDYENVYSVIVGKEYKYAKISMLLVSVLFFIPSTILMFLINASYEMVWLNLIWVFAISGETAVVVFYLWTVYQRKKFLSSSQIEKYAGEIPNNIVKSTPTEIVTKNYIFKRHCPSDPIDLSQVKWVYRKRVTVGGQSSDRIVFRMKNGKKREMNHRVSFTESDVYHLIKKLNPEVMIGNSVENYKRYKEILKKDI